MTTLTAILAVSDDGIIGVDGPSGPTLPWRLPADLKRFRSLTTGHAIIMGRKTFDSIARPLPSRTNIVVTRTPSSVKWPEVKVCTSPHKAIGEAGLYDDKPYLIGGAEIYAALWAMVSRVELTEVHLSIGTGTAFAFDRSGWQETAREPGEHDGLKYDFVTLERA